MRATAEIIETVVRYECPKCGANCQCGVPYIPKTMRAAEAIMANPEKSDRVIAKEVGISKSEVNRARQTTVPDGTVTTQGIIGPDGLTRRRGRDGKWRKLPTKSAPIDDDMPTEEEAEESYQETLYDQVCLFLERMTDETRQRFFAHIKRVYK